MSKQFEDRLLKGDTLTVHPLTPEVIQAARRVIQKRAAQPDTILEALGLNEPAPSSESEGDQDE